MSKIKKGDEITLNYHSIDIGLKKREIRQEFLLRNWGFHCNCVLCEKEKVDCETEKKCEEFEKISKEANELCDIRQNSPMKVTHEKLHREIFCYKEMYRFAKGGLVSEGILDLVPSLNEITVQVFYDCNKIFDEMLYLILHLFTKIQIKWRSNF